MAPVTHRQPDAAAHGVEIPRRVKDHLGLDQQRSWIIATDLNEFLWPGDHMFPIPGGRLDQFDYGTIPQKLLSQVVERIDALAGAALHRIPRDEE
ncbi:hypothetical protein C882_2489 [Caenispirillum salinarum AK4]|uniref:Uncharacterized protein n=1 Tax=Caenispirillum salinarum AK4 TaxID=1238182 RepID=K9H2A0_9PROT|nr:hypothetical protein C882_2489 [Caenispirillum salinarum AK4]